MIKNLQIFTLLLFSVISTSTTLNGQGIDFGAASDFSVLSASGAFNNGGFSMIEKSVGTHVGSVLGFPPGITLGTIHSANANTFEGAAAISTAYNAAVLSPCQFNIGVTLGNDQTLLKGTYCPGDAVTLDGNLNLDADGDLDAVFIIKINGAFATTPNSSITLLNGASSCNVYFQVNGQLTLDTGTDFKGIALVTGAMIILEGASIEGKLLTTAGAVTLTNNSITECLAAIPLPVNLIGFHVNTGADRQSVDLMWQTASEHNNDRFEIERSEDGINFIPLSNLKSKGNTNSVSNYNYSDMSPLSHTNYYRLKIIDNSGKLEYSGIRSISFTSKTMVSVYPNPFTSTLNITLETGTETGDLQFNLYDQLGRNIMSSAIHDLQTRVNISDLIAGPYYYTIISAGKNFQNGHLISR